MFSPFRLGLCVLSVASIVHAAKDAKDEGVPFTISAECTPPQVGTAPGNLTNDLIDGFDYSCYDNMISAEECKKNGVTCTEGAERWRTKDGIPEDIISNFSVGVLISYGLQMIMFIAPIAAFVFISVTYCIFWSCGMMKCCAKNRICCGKCCANPPKFTEGKCEYLLFLIIIASAVAVVGLGLKGMTANAEQNEVVEKFGTSLDLMSTWINNSKKETTDLLADFSAVQVVVAKLQTSLNNVETTELKADAKKAATTIGDSFEDASTSVGEIDTIMTDLDEQISGMSSNMGESITKYNGIRGQVMLGAWGCICGLMLYDVLVSMLRQVKPACTDKISCIFGFMTMLYILVLFLIGIVTIVMSILTITVGDFCQSPDGMFKSVLESMGGDTSVTTTPAAGAALQVGGIDMFAYYITCDTDTSADNVNPFNTQLTNVSSMIWAGAEGTDEVDKIFADAEKAAKDSGNTAKEAGIKRDRAMIAADINSLDASMLVLKESVVGSSQSSTASATDLVFPAQGTEEGLFSIVQCYQMNSRYHALANLFCRDLFNSVAATLEYLLAAVVLMVIVEWMKRLARPYNLEYDQNRVYPEGGDKWAVAKGRDSAA